MSVKRKPLPERHRSQPGIPVGVRRSFWRFVAWYQRTFKPAHRMSITFANADAVGEDGKRRTGFGVYLWPMCDAKDRTVRQYIVIASGAHQLGGDRALWETTAHEFAHYEQWLADAKPNEGEAERRAVELVKLFAPVADQGQASHAKEGK